MLVVCDLVVFVSRLIFCESYQGAEYDQFMYTTSMAAVRLQYMYLVSLYVIVDGRSCTLQKGVMDYCDLSIKQLGQQHWSFNCIPVAVN